MEHTKVIHKKQHGSCTLHKIIFLDKYNCGQKSTTLVIKILCFAW